MRKFWLTLLLVLPFTAFAQTEFVGREQEKKAVLFEEYTGVQCSACPAGHLFAAKYAALYPGKFFAVNIHSGSLSDPYPGDPGLRTADGNTLHSAYNPPGYPSAALNRKEYDDGWCSYENNWTIYIPAILEEDAYVNIAAKADVDWETRKADIKVQLYYTGKPAAKQAIHIALVQDNIIAVQNNGTYNAAQATYDNKYRHLHALRDYLTPIDGESVEGAEKNKFIEKTFQFELPEAYYEVPLVLSNIHFVVFVAEGRNDAANVCEAEITHKNAPATAMALHNLSASDNRSCTPSTVLQIQLQNLLSEVNKMEFALVSGEQTDSYTHTFEPALKPGETVVVPVTSPLAAANEEVRVDVRIAKVNDEAYTYKETRDSAWIKAVQYIAVSPSTVVDLDVCQDRYGTEIKWTVQNEKEETLYSGGPYANLSSNRNKVNSTRIELEKGCYAFLIVDSLKNGINGGFGEGYIAMRANEKEFFRHDGKYTDRLLVMLDSRGATANEAEAAVKSCTLSPNPAKDRTVLAFSADRASAASLKIFDRTGVCVWEAEAGYVEAGDNRIEIPVENLPAGMYFVSLRGKELNFTQKLIVIK